MPQNHGTHCHVVLSLLTGSMIWDAVPFKVITFSSICVGYSGYCKFNEYTTSTHITILHKLYVSSVLNANCPAFSDTMQ